jgi:glycosyltransferase involved in cell wall biosynthesis
VEARQIVKSTLRIHYVSLMGASGYAQAARESIRTLLNAGIEVTWQPVICNKQGFRNYQGGPQGDALLDPLIRQPDQTDFVVLHLMPSLIGSLLHQFRDQRVVIHTVWETDHLPQNWPEKLNQAERVIVPSRWNQQVFRDSGVTVPVHVIPHTLPADLEFTPSDRDKARTVFYSIGEWTNRKALDLLVRAYLRAFNEPGETELVIKTSKLDLTRMSRKFLLRHLINAFCSSAQTVARLRRQSGSRAPISLLRGDLPRSRILDLHRHGHCYVSLCRSEGWGLGAFEAAALGNPVVMTAYGGQTDYLDPELSSLLEYRLVPCATNFYEALFEPDQSWAEVDIDTAAEVLRSIHNDRESAFQKARRLSVRIREDFSAERLGHRWSEVLLIGDGQ